MAKKRLRFRETDLIRAIKAADKAGGNKVVEILTDGVIRIAPALPSAPATTESNPWD